MGFHNLEAVKSSQPVISFSSPPQISSRTRSNDAADSEYYSVADANARLYGYIMGPPPISSTQPVTQHISLSHQYRHRDDSSNTTSMSTMATRNRLGFGISQPINFNLQTSSYVTLIARIVNNGNKMVNTFSYFAKYSKKHQKGTELQSQSQHANFKSQKDQNWSPIERALPPATSLAKYGQTGGTVNYGILEIRRNCSVSELIASAERQFGISGRISDICVIIKKLYSKQVIAYSMALRTLPDPPPIDEDCDMIVFFGRVDL